MPCGAVTSRVIAYSRQRGPIQPYSEAYQRKVIKGLFTSFGGQKVNECVGERNVIRHVKWGFPQYSANPIDYEIASRLAT